MKRTDEVAARHDPAGEVAALMNTISLHREEAFPIPTQSELELAGFDRDHVAALHGIELRDGDPH